METQFQNLHRSGYLSDFDMRLARFLCDVSGSSDSSVFLAAALTSRVVVGGDVCLDLGALQGRRLPTAEGGKPGRLYPPLAKWRRALFGCEAVGRPGQQRPLILDAADRLYFYRYWEIEKQLGDAIISRVNNPVRGVDDRLLKRGLQRLFGCARHTEVDWQAVACIVAVVKRFAVISGGPGTGKTTTVANILSLLIEQAGHEGLRIFLAAPTGKAAARLSLSIRAAKARMDCSGTVRSAIPEEAATIHRLLKPIRESPYFFHCRENPLSCDVLVVDEASMVDVALMSRLVQAMPPESRLILVGDRDQLASVEAGSVLGDICGRQRIYGFSREFADRVAFLTGARSATLTGTAPSGGELTDSIVVLQTSYRFDDAGGIGSLGRAVNGGDFTQVWNCLMDNADPLIGWQPCESADQFHRILAKQVIRGYRGYLSIADPQIALERFDRFRILCAVRKGPMGIDAINESARHALAQAELLPAPRSDRLNWYRGRPVLITRNDYSLGLFNGDIGIALPDQDAGPLGLCVFFEGYPGHPRPFLPYRIDEHETAFAMTVHKSQGSEFEELLLVLPDRDSPVLTRELLYTAVTRARRSVVICGRKTVLETALARTTARASGLRDRLWGQPREITEEFK